MSVFSHSFSEHLENRELLSSESCIYISLTPGAKKGLEIYIFQSLVGLTMACVILSQLNLRHLFKLWHKEERGKKWKEINGSYLPSTSLPLTFCVTNEPRAALKVRKANLCGKKSSPLNMQVGVSSSLEFSAG